MQSELRMLIDGLASSEGEFRRRAVAHSELPDVHVVFYRSEVIAGLVVSVYFEGVNDNPDEFVLLKLTTTIDEPDAR